MTTSVKEQSKKKQARQIILDLKGKISIDTTNITDNGSVDELVDVLKGLGYKDKDIKGMVSKVNRELPLEEQVKEALKLLLR